MINPAAANWGRIPEELRSLKRWCIAGPSLNPDEPKAPHYVGSNGKVYRATVTKPETFMTFNDAANYACQFPDLHIGFVLCAGDGLSCIDLDVKNASNEPNPAKWTPQRDLDRFWSIVQHFDSYTERSRSTNGLHVWLRGEIGQGAKRDGVELYSQERFLITTGDVLLQNPIRAQDSLLNMLATELKAGAQQRKFDLVELGDELTDAEIIEKAMSASNGDKFTALCKCTAAVGAGPNKIEGNYTELGYPSQSEADLALMSIFTFYSRSDEQCRRMFRMSGLGKREKATKDNRHLDNCLQIIRKRQSLEDAARKLENERADEMTASLRAQAEQLVADIQSGKHRQTLADPVAQGALNAAPVATALAAPAQVNDDGLPWPPGLAGAIASFIYHSAPRPVREVAIVATMGILAGICGKSFGIPGSGLNLYMVLIGRSAIGKEAMHSGPALLLKAMRESTPASQTFVDFTEYASGPALTKACAQNQSFVNITGEWGRRLKRLANEDGRDGPMQQLRTVMTNLYQKSGPGSIVGGLGYSNKENNVASVSGVAYSMIGETTPNTYYEALTEQMMEDGFLSRFTAVEHRGERPDENPYPVTTPDKALVEALCGLAVQSLTLLHRFQTQQVMFDQASGAMLTQFDQMCDDRIRQAGDDESKRQMWNRAGLKAKRITALLAAADNWVNPVATEAHATWALDLIQRDIDILQRRMESGDVGNGDPARIKKLMAIIKDYITKPLGSGYKVPAEMHEAGIVPRNYLQIRASRVTSFTGHRAGASNALDMTIKTLIDNGNLMEVHKDKLADAFGFHGRCFRVLNV